MQTIWNICSDSVLYFLYVKRVCINFNTEVSSKCIIKRKFKHWWSTIQPIPTKQTTTSHLNSLNTGGPRYMTMEIHVLAWNITKTVKRQLLLYMHVCSLLQKMRVGYSFVRVFINPLFPTKIPLIYWAIIAIRCEYCVFLNFDAFKMHFHKVKLS